MPRIGDYTPKIVPNISNSPGPVRAPNLPDTGVNLAETAIRSGNQLAGDVIQSGNEVFRATLYPAIVGAVEGIRAYSAAKTHQKAIEDNLQKAQTAAMVSAKSVPLNFAMDDALLQARQSDPNNPQNQLTNFENNSAGIFDKFVKDQDITDSNVVNALKNHYNTGVQVRHYQLANSIPSQVNQLVSKETNESAAKIIAKAGADPSDAGLGSLKRDTEALRDAAHLSEIDGKTFIRKTTHDGLVNWLTANVDKDPNKVAAILGGETVPAYFTDNLSQKEISKFYGDADRTIQGQQKDLEDKTKSDAANLNTEITKYVTGFNKPIKDETSVAGGISKLDEFQDKVDQGNYSPEQQASLTKELDSARTRLNGYLEDAKRDEKASLKEQAVQAKLEDTEKYKSSEGSNARADLQGLSSLITKASSGNKTAALNDVINFRKKADDAYKNGYLKQEIHEKYEGLANATQQANLSKIPIPNALQQQFNWRFAPVPDNLKNAMKAMHPDMTDEQVSDIYHRNINAALDARSQKGKLHLDPTQLQDTQTRVIMRILGLNHAGQQ